MTPQNFETTPAKGEIGKEWSVLGQFLTSSRTNDGGSRD